MPTVTGRSTEARNVAAVTVTNASPTATAAAGSFTQGDVGRTITAASGIQAGTTITAVNAAGSSITLSLNANATPGAATVAVGPDVGGGKTGLLGWSPETEADALTHTIAGGAGASAPTRITAPNVRRDQYNR